MIGDGGGKKPNLYVTAQKGRFSRIHRISGWLLILFFLGAPWLSIAGTRLFFMDLPGRRLYLFGTMFSAMDTQFMLVGLLAGAFSLLLATALLGRLWCGYACPQTVWLQEWVLPIERWIEGKAGARKRLNQGPWTATKVRKKALKWSIFAAISVVVGIGFVSYFVENPIALWTGQSSAGAYGTAAAVAGTIFFDYVWFREQFCNYLCPYARIQSALADENTLVVGYFSNVGEPRLNKLSPKKAQLAANPNACVNCKRCVTACPTGIDIREGYQLECIGCGLCVDACEDVMSKRGQTNLIGYTTEAKLAGKHVPKFRVRPILYAVGLVAIFLVTAGLLAAKQPIDASVNRAPGDVFMVLADGTIRNTYSAHIFNLDARERSFDVALEGDGPFELVLPFEHLALDAGADRTVSIIVLAHPDNLDARSIPLEFVIRSGDNEVRRTGTFKTSEEL